MSPETIVAVSGAVLAVVGAFWRAMAILSALERKLDLHVLDRLGRVEEDVKDLHLWQRGVETQLAHMPRRVNDRQGD